MRIASAAGFAAALMTLSLAVGPAALSATPASATPSAARSAAPPKLVGETIVCGDQVESVWEIAHVRELQYRLACVGAYDGRVTGYFGHLTKAPVQRYQRRTHLPVTGTADRATRKRLIAAAILGRADLRAAYEDGTGWDACYDHTRHEVTLWHDRTLINAWLALGGPVDHQTRTGNVTVYYRDIDHVSSLYNSPVPYSQFFSGGEASHGSATMIDPFTDHSHRCINMHNEDARLLWNLTSKVRLAVHVHGAWS